MQVDLGRVEVAAWDIHLPRLMNLVYFWITRCWIIRCMLAGQVPHQLMSHRHLAPAVNVWISGLEPPSSWIVRLIDVI